MKKNLLLLVFSLFFGLAGAGCSVFSFPPEPPLPLDGTLWLPENATVAARLNFLPDGRASGRVGKNFFFAPTIRGNRDELRFGVISVTSRPGDTGRYEKHFLAMLELTARYAIEADRLTLFDAGGRPLLEFRGTVAPRVE